MNPILPGIHLSLGELVLFLLLLLLLLLLLNWYRLPTLDLLTLIKTLRPHGTHTLAHHRNKNPFCTFCLFSCVGVWLFSLVRRLQVSSGIGSVTHIVLLYLSIQIRNRERDICTRLYYTLIICKSYENRENERSREKKNTITIRCEYNPNEVLFSYMVGSFAFISYNKLFSLSISLAYI